MKHLILGLALSSAALLEPSVLSGTITTTYEVWRSTSNDPSAAQRLAETPDTSFNDRAVTSGMTYYYWVETRTTETVSAVRTYSFGAIVLRISLSCPTSAKRGELSLITVKVDDGGNPPYLDVSGPLTAALYEDDRFLGFGSTQEIAQMNENVTWNQSIKLDRKYEFSVDISKFEGDSNAEVFLKAQIDKSLSGPLGSFKPQAETDAVNVALRDSLDPPPANVRASKGTQTGLVTLSWNAATGNSGFSSSDSGFVKTPCYTLSRSSVPFGQGAIGVDLQSGPNGCYEAGTRLTITAMPAFGYEFTFWSGDASGSSLSTVVVIMDRDKSVTANFRQITGTVTVLPNPTQGGTVAGSGEYPVGTRLQITASANSSSGWAFTGWSDGDNQNPRVIVVPSGNTSYTANFTRPGTITVLANPPTGGTVSGDGTYSVGSQQQISASANPGWKFVSWSDGSTQNSRSVIIPAGGATFTANFTKDAGGGRGLSRELYLNIDGTFVDDLRRSPKFPNSPDKTDTVSTFESWNNDVVNEFERYGQRLSGYILPPVTGNYVFYICSDDQSELWLSSDENPSAKKLIAREPEWHGARTWTGNARQSKRENISQPILLVAGKRYYVEALMKEGAIGDNLGVAWQKPGDPVPSNGSPPIPGEYLRTIVIGQELKITTQPVGLTAYDGDCATFTVDAAGAGPLRYQWRFNGSEIAGATDRVLTRCDITPAQAGSYDVIVSNQSTRLTSQPAQLKIISLPTITGPITNLANGHRYYLLEPSSWYAAETAAKNLGGHLVTINDQSEQDWVWNKFSGFGGVQRGLWIGLYDPDKTVNSPDPEVRKRELIWASGENVSYSQWRQGEPNNYLNIGEYYVCMWPSESLWNDLQGSKDSFLEAPLNGVVEVAGDTTGPSLTINSPANGAKLTSSPITVMGTSSDSGQGDHGIGSVTVNGVNATGGTATGADAANWNASVTLNSGPNTITVVAKDSLNNSRQQQITVTYNPPDTTFPLASLKAQDITTAGGTNHTFTVTYSDNVAVKASTLDNNDIRVTGPNAYNQLASFVNVTASGDGTPRTATYRINAPGGIWDNQDNGTYTVSMEANQVSDPSNNFVASGNLGTFQVSVLPGASQTVSGPSSVSARPGGNFSLPVSYSVSDGNNKLSGLVLRIHYDSRKLTWQSFSQVLEAGKQGQDLQPRDDTNDLDGDPTTDKYLQVTWADPNGAWPNQSLPRTLFNLNFTATSLQNGETTQLRFSGRAAPDYSFAAAPVAVTGLNASLDVDDDGSVDAFTDGFLVLRYLLDVQDADLLRNAVAGGARRRIASEIRSYLGTLQSRLDVDDNGSVDAFTDGFLILRYLLEVQDADLLRNAVGNGARRNTGQAIREYIATLVPAARAAANATDIPSARSVSLQSRSIGLAATREQRAAAEPASQSTGASSPVSVTLKYSTSDNNSSLSGLRVRLHYDSRKLSWVNFTGVLGTAKQGEDSSPRDDANNLDGDPATDKYLQVVWADFANSAWPSASLPVQLLVANFATASTFSGATTINFTSGQTAPGYSFVAPSVTIQAGGVERPTNDDFVNRIRLSGPSVAVEGSNSNGTKEAGEPNHAGKPPAKSIWWSWIAPQSGPVTMTTAGSSVDTLLAIYTGPNVANLIPVTSNDDDPGGGSTSLTSFRAQAGTEYQIAVDAVGGEAGSIKLNILPEPPRPLLRVEVSGKNIVLSWPTSATGFVVEVSDRLEAASWSRFSLTPVVVGDTNSTKIPISGGSKFYRLRRQ